MEYRLEAEKLLQLLEVLNVMLIVGSFLVHSSIFFNTLKRLLHIF